MEWYEGFKRDGLSCLFSSLATLRWRDEQTKTEENVKDEKAGRKSFYESRVKILLIFGSNDQICNVWRSLEHLLDQKSVNLRPRPKPMK